MSRASRTIPGGRAMIDDLIRKWGDDRTHTDADRMTSFAVAAASLLRRHWISPGTDLSQRFSDLCDLRNRYLEVGDGVSFDNAGGEMPGTVIRRTPTTIVVRPDRVTAWTPEGYAQGFEANPDSAPLRFHWSPKRQGWYRGERSASFGRRGSRA